MTTSTAAPLRIPQLLAWITGIAVILFSVAGFAALLGWIPGSVGGDSDRPQLAGTAKAPAKTTLSVAVRAGAVPMNPPLDRPELAVCARCGVIVSIQDIVSSGETSGLGAAGGAIVGGLLGRQLGGGRGRDIATLVGAVGGAVAGNEVEKRVKTTRSREITVLLDDGATRVLRVAETGDWESGDHVKIVKGVLQRN